MGGIYCETYGCTMNRGDTELMLGRLQHSGFEIVDNLEGADIAIVNTCAVKGPTMRRVLHRCQKLKESKGKKVIVAGCLPLIDLEAIERIGPFNGIISCTALDSIVDVAEKVSRDESEVRALHGKTKKVGGPRLRRSNISAPIAIAEGCASNCSFCCVKFARGKVRSFQPKEILNEVKEELQSGRREILLTSQDTAAYGIENDFQLPHLLKMISSIDEKFMVRLGMMNPALAKNLIPELVKAFDNEKIYKFLHLPVQSGNDDILRRMRRAYTVNDFLRIVEVFEKRFPDLYLATDVIVGFPGEDEEAFEDSCKLIEQVNPDKVNLTRFSPMPGTDASKWKQISESEKKRRSKKLSEIHRRTSQAKNEPYVGRIMSGLITKKGKKGGYVARLSNYKPTIVEDGSPSDFVRVKIREARPTYLMGDVIEVID